MAIKQLGAAPSGSTDADTKGARDTAITAALNAADGSGLVDNGSGVLSVGAGTGITVNADDVAVTANYRSIAIPFFMSSTLTTGVKLPKWIAPVACTVVDMKGVCASGASATYRPSKNGGTTDGTTSASTGTSVVSTSQSLSLAAGDTLTVNVVAAGTGSDLSVTFWANIT